ncbi:hypothetical protein THMIRHAM_12870 [Thiomicrorhabdus immobilis]|uniref:Metallo-beta-lactamase domain-containing protein n=1 Tax=Thiomicrorhabdus immobilis TaxID=2791037 RepID=A0ABM7MDM7_9GAMM|nr:MBL fold metallo-hydrolase [Thiomicrorhabdus immobilis]BCN93502.1 hypothetical protein THMIRHAM_12870 [Thiomicrorhabdus immobilis]
MQDSQFELVVLGTGGGASAIYDGLASSSFMLLHQGTPFCLVDLGLGVGREVVTQFPQFSQFPRNVIITHNHSDHSGDLPVVLRVEQARGNKMQVFAAKEVSRRLQTYRMAEHLQQLSVEELADWPEIEPFQSVELSHGLTIEFYPGFHSELSYGFVLRDQQGQARLGYTGDSCVDSGLYDFIQQAQVCIFDARLKPNTWHASFAELKDVLKANAYIIGHGLTASQVQQEFLSLPLLVASQRITF